MICARVAERVGLVGVVEVPDRRVDEVEDRDEADLHPPVERVAVAEPPPAAQATVQRRRGGVAGGDRLRAGRGHGVGAGSGSSAGSCRCQRRVLMAVPDRERGRTEQAHDQHHPVPEQADADGASGGDAERVQEQHEQAFTDAEARERDRHHLTGGDRGHERQHGRVRHVDAEGVDRAPHDEHHRELVDERGDEHAQRLLGLPADAVDADVHRADEAHPVGVLGEPPRDPGVARDHEDHDERDDRRDLDRERDPRVRHLEQRRHHREPHEGEQREHDEAAQALDHHRREGDVGGAGGLPGPAHPEDVAADRRRQHVADELAGEVVRQEGAERHVRVEHREHALPAPRREHEADERHQQPGGEERDRARVVVARGDAVGGDLRDQERQQRDAHRDAKAELHRCGHDGGAVRDRARAPRPRPPFPHVTGWSGAPFTRVRR